MIRHATPSDAERFSRHLSEALGRPTVITEEWLTELLQDESLFLDDEFDIVSRLGTRGHPDYVEYHWLLPDDAPVEAVKHVIKATVRDFALRNPKSLDMPFQGTFIGPRSPIAAATWSRTTELRPILTSEDPGPDHAGRPQRRVRIPRFALLVAAVGRW